MYNVYDGPDRCCNGADISQREPTKLSGNGTNDLVGGTPLIIG